ncbi:hypothetical protein [Nocardia cyriacigeorgica]|uniref:hypothetical protein n=1 Tax=Nocardia cyriacigeorgica TaxID=135487 RepID=UPI001895DDC6|nr:hypothetical protein [Nocardia cyriacigeorgica]MBF6161053.1 hypothetical protein [Nocardia cyriacigeorgica]MBF6199852.1 hypothetical protein [Nocardia cyriacigeorgica]
MTWNTVAATPVPAGATATLSVAGTVPIAAVLVQTSDGNYAPPRAVLGVLNAATGEVVAYDHADPDPALGTLTAVTWPTTAPA